MTPENRTRKLAKVPEETLRELRDILVDLKLTSDEHTKLICEYWINQITHTLAIKVSDRIMMLIDEVPTR